MSEHFIKHLKNIEYLQIEELSKKMEAIFEKDWKVIMRNVEDLSVFPKAFEKTFLKKIQPFLGEEESGTPKVC